MKGVLKMAKVNGGDLFVRALKREGVKYIFTLCGGHIASIYNACIDEGIGIIDVRHEQVAAHAAAGWARVTGEPGVAVVTAGPGVTDSVTGVAEAFMAGCPMIEFGGRSPLVEFEIGSLQDMDQLRLMEPITKWAKTIYEARRIPEYVSIAFRQAKSGTPGPVYLECPVDVLLGQRVEESEVTFPTNYYAEAESTADPALLQEAVELLMAAERPMVIAGEGLFWAKGDKELKELVELAELPVQTTGFARGAVPEDHPLSLGWMGTSMADVILALGVRFDFTLTYGRPPLFNADAKMIQVGVDPSMIGYNRGADIGIVANPKAVLKQMIEEIKRTKKGAKTSAWIELLRAMAKATEERNVADHEADTLPIHPGRLAKEVVEFLDKDAVVVLDGGDCAAGWFAPMFRVQAPGQLLSSGALGCLGVGTGFALAAKLAKPDKQVLIYSGDGSFGLNGMEFDTFVRFDLPVVAVISNDSAWGMVKHGQRMMYGEDRLTGTLLKPRQRYEKMVEALGGYGEYVDKVEDIKPALGRAFASGMPACINVEVDPKPCSPATMFLARSLGA
jgi:acetolactate synthase-1/2/3 large subunit